MEDADIVRCPMKCADGGGEASGVELRFVEDTYDPPVDATVQREAVRLV